MKGLREDFAGKGRKWISKMVGLKRDYTVKGLKIRDKRNGRDFTD
jgi:hypothetical protein